MSIYHLLAAVLVLSHTLGACRPVSTLSDPTRFPPSIPSKLSIAEYPLAQPPDPESSLLNFDKTVKVDPRLLRSDERAKRLSFEDMFCTIDNHFGLCASLGTDQLAASAINPGFIALQRNGKEIYRITVGGDGAIPPLRGLWVYDGHWVLETAFVTERQVGM